MKTFKLREGFALDLVASEPAVEQPLSLAWDAKGRLWAVLYRQYQFPAGLKIVEYDNHLRARFDKVPLPPPHGEKERTSSGCSRTPMATGASTRTRT